MNNDFKKLVDKIIWWLPTYKLRLTVRNFVESYINMEKSVMAINNYFKFGIDNNKLFDKETYHKSIFSNFKYISNIDSNNDKITFYSQEGQDLLAYTYFKGKKEGFFIDIGAYDGITISNTLLFEELGWKGICVEADPDRFKSLKNNRKCDCYNLAIHSKTGEKLEFITSNCDVLNVLKEQSSDKHIERMKIDGNQKELKTIEVNSITFDDLMSKNYPDIRHIDFLSIDIEGGELIVLETIDFNKYSFGLITVENNFEEGVLVNFMKERGYKVLIDIGLDILFIKE